MKCITAERLRARAKMFADRTFTPGHVSEHMIECQYIAIDHDVYGNCATLNLVSAEIAESLKYGGEDIP